MEQNLARELIVLNALGKEIATKLLYLNTAGSDIGSASNVVAETNPQGVVQIARQESPRKCKTTSPYVYRRFSVEPAAAQAAEGHRAASPVGVRHKKVSASDCERKLCQQVISDIKSAEERCNCAIQHFDFAAAWFHSIGCTGSTDAGSTNNGRCESPATIGKHLKERIAEARALCGECRELSNRALRCTNANDDPWRGVQLPLAPESCRPAWIDEEWRDHKVLRGRQSLVAARFVGAREPGQTIDAKMAQALAQH